MLAHLRANLWLLVLTVLLCSVLYPLAVLALGQTFFHDKAEGSLLTSGDGKTIVGSRLIAQPFTGDEYFQPRPSAASFNAAASAASNLAANNYLLRDRVARQLGPIAKYAAGPKQGQLVAGDVEHWFQKDRFDGKAGIVAQWAAAHAGVASAWLHDWVKADKLNAAYVVAWEKAHPDAVARWKCENSTDPSAEELAAGIAGDFFASFAHDHPGRFPGATAYEKDGKTATAVGPVKEGGDIQSLFFDMWLTEYADAELQQIPADAVTTSGSGLDPHITLANARWQLDRVAAAWAKKTGGREAALRAEIEKLLAEQSVAPLGGLVGVPLVNVLEMNVELQKRYGK
jgi:potassium-transporting ATPase KdpC subunit